MKNHLRSIGKNLLVDDGVIYAKARTTWWKVYATDGETFLGDVKWFSNWRCYAFYPNASTIFEKVCMRDLASFCEIETRAHYSHCKKLRELSKLA